MKRLFLLPVLSLLLLTACGESDETEETSNETTPKEEPIDSSVSETISLQKKMEVINLNSDQIPETTEFDGNFIAAHQWVDANGSNLVILSESGIQQQGDYSGGFVYGNHFLDAGEGYASSWRETDAINGCEFDAYCEHVKGSLTITDLDSNGVAETAFIYRTTCTSDVSPMDQKLIMYEGSKKMTISGKTAMDFGDGMKEEGTMEPNEAFTAAPPQMLEHAKKLWSRFNTSSFN
jgi:hypothetical protein